MRTYLVDKVSGFDGPSSRDVTLLYVDLFGKHHVAYVLACLADVRTPAKHELVSDDAHSEIVDSICVILSTHDLRCHIAGRARGVLTILGLPNFCYTHVRDAYIASVLHYQIFGLDVSVNDALCVHVLKSTNQTGKHEFCFGFGESPPLTNMVSKVSTREQITHQIEILAVLERKIHINKESAQEKVLNSAANLRVLQFLQEPALVDDRLNRSFEQDASFGHFFHSIQLHVLSALHAPHLSTIRKKF